jgi:predicted dehydrogenase
LLADSAVDAVYIPLPNELHKPWVLAAADAGKHILCEKPLALNTAEAEEMVEHCRQRGVLLMEAFMWRHQPRSRKLVELIRDGLIGDLRLIRSSFSFPIDPGDWRLDASRGGGALWDVGCYGINTARLFAEAEPISVRAHTHRGPGGVDLSLVATIEFPNNQLAMVDCSFEQPFRCVYELVGTQGVVIVPDAYLPPTERRPSALVRTIGSACDSGTAGDQCQVMEFDAPNQYAEMVDAFARSVHSGGLEWPAESGLEQMMALDAIQNSALSAK